MDRVFIRCFGIKLMENLLIILQILLDVYFIEYLICNIGGLEKKEW